MRFPDLPPSIESRRFFELLRSYCLDLERAIVAASQKSATVVQQAPAFEANPQAAKWTTGSNTTLNVDDMNLVHFINASGNFNLTLPTASEGLWIEVFNYGTGTITVKNAGGTTIGSIYQYFSSRIEVWPDASGNPAWPVNIQIEGASNLSHFNNDLVQLDNTKGFVYKDSANHWWRLTINTAGALVSSDLGTSPPSTESAPA